MEKKMYRKDEWKYPLLYLLFQNFSDFIIFKRLDERERQFNILFAFLIYFSGQRERKKKMRKERKNDFRSEKLTAWMNVYRI